MSHSRRPMFLLILTIAALALAPVAHGQVTTGNIAGTVTAQGDAIPGVTIEAVHVPTGTRYSTVTGSDGRYTIPNVRVGGPYRITERSRAHARTRE